MMQYAGPLNSGDMAIRANEVSPGIAALLSKQMRNKPMSGIYELPSAKPATPDFYNSALENVQNNLRNAARTVNSLAPEGERLAYINPEEEGILRLLGGSGEPEPVTGIPSFALSGSQFSKAQTAASRAKNITGQGGTSFSALTQSNPKSTGATMATSPETGGRQTYYATDAASAEAVSKAREAAARQQAGQAFTTASEALSAASKQPELETMLGLAKEGAQEEKGFFQKLFDSVSKFTPLGMITNALGDYNFNWYMENIDPEMGKKFKALSEEDQQKLKENKYLIPGYDEYWEDRRQKALAEQEKQRDRGGDKKQVVEEEVTEEEVIPEDEIDFFNWYRRFIQPMSREDILARAYGGSTGPLLETIQEAKDSETV